MGRLWSLTAPDSVVTISLFLLVAMRPQRLTLALNQAVNVASERVHPKTALSVSCQLRESGCKVPQHRIPGPNWLLKVHCSSHFFQAPSETRESTVISAWWSLIAGSSTARDAVSTLFWALCQKGKPQVACLELEECRGHSSSDM